MPEGIGCQGLVRTATNGNSRGESGRNRCSRAVRRYGRLRQATTRIGRDVDRPPRAGVDRCEQSGAVGSGGRRAVEKADETDDDDGSNHRAAETERDLRVGDDPRRAEQVRDDRREQDDTEHDRRTRHRV